MLRTWADYGLVLLVFLVAGGHRVPDVNEPHYLTRLKHFWDPDWVHSDLFLDSPDAHFTVVLLFGWTTLWLPLAAVAWIGRLMTWGLLAWAWRRLSWQVTPTLGVAGLSAGLWCVGVLQGNFAGEWVVGGFEAKGVAWAMVIAALGSYLRYEWRLVWVQLGLASAFHVLVGGWSVVILAGLWLLKDRSHCSLRQMAPGLLMGGLIALAGVLPPILMNSGLPAETSAEGARIYVYERLPHHLAPLSKGPEWLIERGGRHAIVLLLLLTVSRWAARSPQRAAVRRLGGFAWGAVLLAAIGLAIEGLGASDPQATAGWLRIYWFRMTDIAAPMVVAMAIGAWIAAENRNRPRVTAAGLAASMAVLALGLATLLTDRVLDPPRADKGVRDLAAWVDVCQWASTKTPPHSLFLTPRYSNSFVWRAGRPEVVAFKHIPQNAAGLVEWWRRINDVHSRPSAAPAVTGWVANLGQLGSSRLRQLAESYGIDYVLTDRRSPVSLPVAYRNNAYVVYDLRQPSPQPAP